MHTRTPPRGSEVAGDRLDLGARRGVGRGERGSRECAVREKTLRHPDAADLQRFESLGREAAADDEFGRAAADVYD